MHKESLMWRGMIVCIALVMFFACGCADETAEVQAAWDRYVAASKASDGQTMVSLLNRNSIAYFGDIQQHALKSTREQVRALSYFQKSLVLSARANVDPEYMRQLTPEQFIMVGVRDGWLGTDASASASIEIKNIRISADRATADFVANGQVAPFQYVFTKEDGFWKHDLVELMEWFSDMAAQAMRALAAQGAAMSEDGALLAALRIQTGKPIGPEIWDPPKPR